MVTISPKESKVYMVGQKQMLFSQKFIQECNYAVLKNLIAVPYHDEDENAAIKGCRLLMLSNIVNIKHFNLLNLLE